MNIVRTLLAAAIAVAAFSSAHAQEGEVGATLEVNRGSVMVSQEGGEFASVSGSARVQADSRIMLAEDSAGTLVFANGCRMQLDSPGVHGVPAQSACDAMMAGSDTGAGIGTAAGDGGNLLLLGGTVAVALVLANMGDSSDPAPPPPPVSP